MIKKSTNKNILFLKCLIIISGIIFLFFPMVNATTIYGNVYGPDLSLLKNTLIIINSTPIQNYVAINGNYSFDLPIGIYEINSIYRSNEITLKSKDIINIKEEGEFIYDLILFDIEEVDDIGFDDKALIEQTVNDSANFLDKKTDWILISIFLLIGIFIFIILFKMFLKIKKKQNKTKNKNKFYIKNKSKKEKGKNKNKNQNKDLLLESEKISSDEILNKIYAIIKKEKRINQKDIRRIVGMSEAKISLAITDLEARGLIKRIKVGRGNIVILKE